MATNLPIPAPRVDVSIRVATMADLPALDALQAQYGKALGFFPKQQFEEYVAGGNVLVAVGATLVSPSPVCARNKGDTSVAPTGYVISRDRYLKRDELGVIYQLCVAPGAQRKLVGASLVKAAFERSAYGCRLYCCWCAQDLAANHFWESLGFVPIAFRAGSDKKKRVHIFWQKRIVDGDATPWWYPFKTDQGAMREDRLVFPIPPGTHWSEVRAVVVPMAEGTKLEHRNPTQIEDRNSKVRNGQGDMGGTPMLRKTQHSPNPSPITRSTGLQFAAAAAPAGPAKEPEAKPRPRRPKADVDPRLLAAARELRDRYLERVNADARALPPTGKYALSRALPAATPSRPVALLPAA